MGTNLPGYLSLLVTSGSRPQPFVLLLGENCNPSQTFVTIEGRALPAKSLLKTVDLCFKVIYVFDVEYPKHCISTWEFLQKVMYGITDGKGKSATAPAVRSFEHICAICAIKDHNNQKVGGLVNVTVQLP